ncbi:MAG: ABC transporter substrate-binding protein, partial [Acidobacteriota bacterium]
MIGTRLADRYELLEEIGRGGMGIVYLARDPQLDREVAIKMIVPASLSMDAERRFRREAELVARLDHPAITPIYDFGRHGEALFFVMPVVSGQTLAHLLRSSALSLGDILEITAQVAEALGYSHVHGVIHRDVKPENIMVERLETGPRVRVMDFGLAVHPANVRLTQTGKLFGTLTYFSPERAASRREDGRSDLYALGTILYESIAGAPPFEGVPASMLYRIIHEHPRPLIERGIDIPQVLDALILACLAKRTDGRPESGVELARQLRAIREQLPPELLKTLPHSPVADAVDDAPRVPHAAPFVGRAEELDALKQALQAAVRGSAQLVLVGGEPGAGKSRLLQEFELYAVARRLRVLRGRFSDPEGTFPYQGFCELIQDYFRSNRDSPTSTTSFLPDKALDLSDLAPDLLAVFPVLSEIGALRAAALGEAMGGSLEDAARQGDRTPLYELLARTLLRLADGQPLVLLLDSLHAAHASIEALQYLVRRLGASPVLVVGGYRQTEIDRRHPLHRMISSSRDDPNFVHLVLGPLAAAAHRRLVEALMGSRRVSDALAQKLYESTEGNPFFTGELVRALLTAGDVLPDADTGAWHLTRDADLIVETLPETIQQAVERRLERLPDAALQVLTHAAVLGKRFDYEDLLALAASLPEPLDEAMVERLIDRLIQLELLQEQRHGRGDRLHFVSGVVRDVLYGSLSRRRRRTLHALHAEHLERRWGGRLERVYPQLVYHFGEGDIAERTVDYAIRLARQSLEACSAEDAMRAVRTALEFVEDEAFDQRRGVEGELRLLLAASSRQLGTLPSALKEAGRAVRVFSQGEQLGDAARAALLAAEIAWQVRRVEDAHHWVETGIELARASLALPGEGAAHEAGEAPPPPTAAPMLMLDPLDSMSLAARETLRKLLTLGATVANLRGVYSKARAYLAEADDLAAKASTTAAPAVPTGGVLITALPTTSVRLDPTDFVITEDTEVLANVFEPLLRTDREGNLIPHLCAAWEGDRDGRRFRLTLRPDVRFSDGTALTALAVKRSLERAARRGHPPPAACAVIAGVDAFRAAAEGAADAAADSDAADAAADSNAADAAAERDGIAGLTVLSEHVLEIELQTSLPIFPALLTDLRTAIVRQRGAAQRFDADAVAGSASRGGAGGEIGPLSLLGTGPFCLHAVDDARLELRRNLQDWRALPAALDGIVFRMGLGAAEIAADLRDGALDVGRDLLPGDLEAILRDPRYRGGLAESIQRNTYFILLNAHSTACGDRTLRRVLTSVLRVRDLVWRTLGRFAQPATSLLPPGILGHDPGRRRRMLTVEQARELLQIGGARLPLTLRAAVHPHLRDRHGTLLEAIRTVWRALDIDLEIVTETMSEYLACWHAPERVDLLLGRWNADYEDPDDFTYRLLHRSEGLLGGYVDLPEGDALLERARQERRLPSRQVLYRRYEGMLADSWSLLPLFHDVDYRIAAAHVHGLRLRNHRPYVNYDQLRRDPRGSGAALGETPSSSGQPRGRIYVPLTGALQHIDPIYAYTQDTSEVTSNVFEPLTRVDEAAQVRPHLAVHMEREPGGRRYRFILREDVRFHDGRRLTVRDVRYSFERLLREGDNYAAYPLHAIRGARALRAGTSQELRGFRIHGASAFSIELEAPLVPFAAMLSTPITGIVPE